MEVTVAGRNQTVFVRKFCQSSVRGRVILTVVDLEPAETGGYKIITTLDWDAQAIAKKPAGKRR